ncbi:hypothetical protein HYW73_04150 [Candidatus Nomurabacteria bacterium]|nr:hypothetical protein [Candidatus Nomurabacteria bacterium]
MDKAPKIENSPVKRDRGNKILIEPNIRQQNRLLLFALAVRDKNKEQISKLSATRDPVTTDEERVLFWNSVRDQSISDNELRWFPEHVAGIATADTSENKLAKYRNALEYLLPLYKSKSKNWGGERYEAICYFGIKQVEYAEQFLFLQAKIEKVRKIENYIKKGLQLIRQGLYKEAEDHFNNYENSLQIGIYTGQGEHQTIESLLSREQLNAILYRIVQKSRPTELPAYGTVNWPKEMDEMPELYSPELVREFKYEIALICAEEWIHKLQRCMGVPTAGEKNDEVDIAAYLDKEGFCLSDHFVTRYGERADWFVKKHPEREKSVREFEAAH